jgi:hypothetical protein
MYLKPPTVSTAERYDAVLAALLDEHAPAKTVVIRDRRKTQWYTPELRAAKQDRRWAESVWLKTGLNVHEEAYKKKKEYNRLVNQTRSNYIKVFLMKMPITLNASLPYPPDYWGARKTPVPCHPMHLMMFLSMTLLDSLQTRSNEYGRAWGMFLPKWINNHSVRLSSVTGRPPQLQKLKASFAPLLVSLIPTLKKTTLDTV